MAYDELEQLTGNKQEVSPQNGCYWESEKEQQNTNMEKKDSGELKNMEECSLSTQDSCIMRDRQSMVNRRGIGSRLKP